MAIDKDKSNIPRFTSKPASKKDSKPFVIAASPELVKKPEAKFISKDINNHFNFSVGRKFDRSIYSKNSVTYDLNSFDEKRN